MKFDPPNPIEINVPPPRSLDTRTRVEKREDFERELNEIDQKKLEGLVQYLRAKEKKIYNDKIHDDIPELIENSIIKLSIYIKKFEQYGLEEERKLAIKYKELKLEASHDWREKFRLFIFRILASLLFIITLFSIGYIEHNYEWARLPLSKYVKIIPSTLK
jgi:hypothetical protein